MATDPHPALRLGFFVSGYGHLCRAAVAAAELIGITPVQIVGGPRAAADLESFCLQHGMAFTRIRPRSSQSELDEQLEACLTEDLDAIALTFDRIVPSTLIQRFGHCIFNVHPALLPAFPGLNAMTQAIEAGVRMAGVTIHTVVEAVDSGPIIIQGATHLGPDDDVQSLGQRLYALMEPMYLQTLAWYAQRRVHLEGGNIRIDGAQYGELPIAPMIELRFPAKAH